MATKKVAPAKTKPRARPAKTTTTAGVASDATPHGLNPRQRAFVVEYLADKNATQAAIRAGYSAATARQIGSRLLTDVVIRAEVESQEAEALAKVQAETGITLERTLRSIAAVAFHDPRKFFDDAGNLKPIHELDDETASALAGMDIQEEFAGSGEARVHIGRTKKVKIAERKGYLDMLMRHLGGYKKDNEQAGEAAAAALAAGISVRFIEPNTTGSVSALKTGA
jgi:phage terminase small subunit